ncbi:hypothetical protein GCK72_016748 [Caenorhabditis remanei]|uniref:Uncharacterized protein n=1 Tax=Caenorhabditis remanei TaxID=31234 RepID=A0A6A5G675_CAERE|nr:hypothetical protein GCK72_016748 [Caenorhabditis remanei]KAF1750201.1 hypothetical protein GCK72_016748 [Caenorhabditis remanei]
MATRLWVVLDRQILATNHTVSLEPLTTELLGGTIRSVSPLDGDTVVVSVLKHGNLGFGIQGFRGVLPPVRRRRRHKRQPKEQPPLGRALRMVDPLQDASCWWS